VNRFLLRDASKDWTDLQVHLSQGGFAAVRKAFGMSSDAIIDEVKRSNLRGRGGAGFPTGVKWSFVPKESDKPKYLAVNGDESEPGTFKDRYWLEKDPYPLIEGCIICAFALGIHTAYIYIRGEMLPQIRQMERAVAQCRKAGLIGKNILGTGFDLDIWVHPGAGAYICGEETAMLSSIEGTAGQPKLKPPFPAVEGLFGCPTVINNVETLACVPAIIERGGEWFAALGPERNGGTKVFCVSGHVKKPGLYELPLGVTLREVIYEHCGGTLDDRPLKAVIPGGSSCPVLTPDEIDTHADFDSMAKAGTMLGTAGTIVICEPTSLVEVLIRIAHFYAHESCGQCTPCREGTGWMLRILHDIQKGIATEADVDLLVDAANHIEGNTICGLGDAAAWPVQSFVRKFRDEFVRHVRKSGEVSARA
jgi:NADH-quinone oxidoreductase subunit F